MTAAGFIILTADFLTALIYGLCVLQCLMLLVNVQRQVRSSRVPLAEPAWPCCLATNSATSSSKLHRLPSPHYLYSCCVLCRTTPGDDTHKGRLTCWWPLTSAGSPVLQPPAPYWSSSERRRSVPPAELRDQPTLTPQCPPPERSSSPPSSSSSFAPSPPPHLEETHQTPCCTGRRRAHLDTVRGDAQRSETRAAFSPDKPFVWRESVQLL